MYKTLLIVALAAIMAPSCVSPKAKKATNWNNKLAEISKMNQDRWKDVIAAINSSQTTKDYAKVGNLGKDLVSFLDGKIKEVNDMENTEGSEKMKEAMIEFLEYEKKTAQDGLSPYLNMNQDTPPEEVQSTYESLSNMAREEATHLSKLQAAQREFAAKYGLKVKEQ
ncbi:MAG TPA: hypothetical protein VLJ68_00745 [Chitinophagaceae bacterium]|nr:hypothetical protein [Chitinophagaceae bacterium]